MFISYRNACAAILSEPAPLLYLDTCIFLDIIRSPIKAPRGSIDSASARYAAEFQLRAEASPRKLWLVTSETVQSEWNENSPKVVEEVKREILQMELGRAHLLAAATAVSNMEYEHGQRVSSLDLQEQLLRVASSLLDICMIIKPDDVHMVGAMQRVKQNLPPAKRGKSEPKDCEIYELFFCLCQHLRSNGFSRPCVFASSNKKDYGVTNSGGIQPELNSINGKFVSSFPWMEAIISGRV